MCPMSRNWQNYAKRRMSSNRSYPSIRQGLIFPLVSPTKSTMVMISSSLQPSQNANNGVVKPNKKSESSRKIPSHFKSKNKPNSVEKPSNVEIMKLPKLSNTAELQCCRTRTKDAINPATTQRTQHKEQKPHRELVSQHAG